MLPLPDGTVTVLLADTSPTISLGLPPTSTVTDFDDPHGFVYDNVMVQYLSIEKMMNNSWFPLLR